jgi:hypothetical protein
MYERVSNGNAGAVNVASRAFAASAFADTAGFDEGAADITVLVGFPPLAA